MLHHARGLLAEVGANAGEHSNGFLRPARVVAELSRRIMESGLVAEDDFFELENYLFQSLQNEPQISGIYYGDEAGNFTYFMRSDGPAAFRTKVIRSQDDKRISQLIWRNSDFVTVATALDPADTFDPRNRPWYERAKPERTTIWTDPYGFFSSQQPGVSVATPVLIAGQFRGAIGVDIEISTLSNFLSQLAVSENGTALILNDNGDVIAHSDMAQIIVKSNDATRDFVGISDISDPVARAVFRMLRYQIPSPLTTKPSRISNSTAVDMSRCYSPCLRQNYLGRLRSTRQRTTSHKASKTTANATFGLPRSYHL